MIEWIFLFHSRTFTTYFLIDILFIYVVRSLLFPQWEQKWLLILSSSMLPSWQTCGVTGLKLLMNFHGRVGTWAWISDILVWNANHYVMLAVGSSPLWKSATLREGAEHSYSSCQQFHPLFLPTCTWSRNILRQFTLLLTLKACISLIANCFVYWHCICCLWSVTFCHLLSSLPHTSSQ